VDVALSRQPEPSKATMTAVEAATTNDFETIVMDIGTRITLSFFQTRRQSHVK
jgi:hypothetical protein